MQHACPYHLPAWLLWVQALGIPALAGVGAFLAYQQMQIARTKLQHDPYERRIKVYLGIAEFLADISIVGQVSPESLARFYAATREAQFLYPRAIDAFIWELHRKTNQLESTLRSIRAEPGQAELEKLLDREEGQKDWLHGQQQKLGTVFGPHLRIGPA